MTDEHTGEGRPAVDGDEAAWAPAPTSSVQSERTGPDSTGQDSTAPESPWWAGPATPSQAPPSYAPPPVYDAPSYNPPPAYGPPPAYDAPPAYSPPTAYEPPPAYSPPAAYDPPSAYEAAPASYRPTVPYPGGAPASTPFAVPTGPPPPGGYDRDSGRRRPGWSALLIVAVVAALVGAGVAGGIVAANKKTASTTPVTTSPSTSASASASTVNASTPAIAPTAAPQGGAESVAQIAKALLPSVVSIIVTSGTSGDEGTGIVLSADGNILTNNHVVEAAATAGTIAVTINDGRSVKATIVGRDPTTDLAVIKAAGVTDLHPATLGQDSTLVVGQQVIAIGSPLGLSNTVTSGIISSLNRPVCTQSCNGGTGAGGATPTVLDAIQTDAAINPGNSGGPLVNMAGEVVGVNSAIATLDQGQSADVQSGSIGVGFSIPIDEARRVVDELEKTGHADHAVLGIGLRDSFDNVLHTPNGALVLQVTASGPAAKSGLRVNDVIVKFGTRTIVDADSLIAATHAAAPNSTIAITYTRQGASSTVQLSLGSAPSS